jgi:hypothetical protein
MSYAFFIEYALRETTSQDVEDMFNRTFGENFVSSIDESVTQGYKESWKAFTVHSKDICIEQLSKMTIHEFTDNYTLYYTPNDFWVIHLIMV